jgi:uncharacterized protein YqjF (DUF2071 family)
MSIISPVERKTDRSVSERDAGVTESGPKGLPSRPRSVPMVVPLEMGWRHLLFENWPIDPGVMDAHLPDGLEPDVHDGSAWLSIVPFTNVAVRPAGVPEALGIRLPELNVRTYVTRDGVPSVYFFSLDAQGIASVLGARLFHHLPYYYARISLDRTDGRVRFSSRRRHPGARPARYEGAYWPTGSRSRPPAIRSGRFSSSATGSTPGHRTGRYGTRPSTTTRGRCTRLPPRSERTRCSPPTDSRDRTPTRCTTTVRASTWSRHGADGGRETIETGVGPSTGGRSRRPWRVTTTI